MASRDTKKKCLKCGSEGLLCKVVIIKFLPLADRNGTVKIGGHKVGQMDLKNSWDTTNGKQDGPDQRIRGPIICPDCETEHYYLVGDAKPLRMGNVDEAREVGYDALASA